MLKTKKLAAFAALTTLACSPVLAQGNEEIAEKMKTLKPVSEVGGQQLGVLECTIAGGWGKLVVSSKKATCEFKHNNGALEKYTGLMEKLGIDIGKTEESYMTWVVFTTAENKPGDFALEGQYVGASAGASLGIGLGANALVGGSAKQIGLQPVSVEGFKGLNLALGLASLTLDKAE